MTPLSDLVGDSPKITAIRETIERLLRRHTDARRLPPILIQGETGTGKGLLAHGLHHAGPRAKGPFVDVNCAAIPATLVESELFGYERGAFTDARQAKRGLFQAAHQGTIFLDEVGLLPEALQGKLLKVIEEREVRRLGSTRSEPVDAWLLAATSEDLLAATRVGRFREDLYHRLAVLTIWLPPLRERGGDVIRLAEHFLARACADYDLPSKRLSAAACVAIQRWAWPGNVRELANAMERVALLSETVDVTPEVLELPEPADERREDPTRMPAPLDEMVDEVERQRLLDVLTRTRWNVSQAAATLGLPRNTLRYRMERHGLRAPGATPPRGRAKPAPIIHPAPPPAAVLPQPAASARIRWERRRLTLVRAVLSDESGESVSPADSSRSIEILIEKLLSFGGRVEELSSRSIVAAFGIEPVEDAPTRAAVAAMAIQRAATRALPGDAGQFGVRLALHVEPFMVGHLDGRAVLDLEVKREAWSVLDELLRHCEPGSVLVSGAVAPFLERRFDLLAAGRTLRGQPAYRLGRFDVTGFRHGGRRASFVGRQHELALLSRCLDAVTRGHGQVIGIAGDPGIGKSRLLHEFRQGLTGSQLGSVEGQCLSWASSVPYLPVLDAVRAICEVTDADGPDAIVDKVRAALTSVSMEQRTAVPVLLQLLGVAPAADSPSSLSPEEVKARTFEVLRELILRRSRQRPLVLVVEDLHWMDRTSEEYFTELAGAIAAAPVLMVTTYRPGYLPPWRDRSYFTQMALRPLALDDSLAVVRSVLGSQDLTRSLEESIVSKAEGNPFFLEELARAIREQDSHPPTLVVPDTIEEVLLARIDRLPPSERGLLQEAAVIGKDVSLALIHAVTDMQGEPLRRGLSALGAGEFLLQTGTTGEPGYTFKHALTHEVAYTSLSPERRRGLHGRILAALERLQGDRLVERVEEFAHHAFQGGAWEKAVEYLRQAGARAFARASHQEAAACFEQALVALGHLPDSPERSGQRIDLRFDLQLSLLPLGHLQRGLEQLSEAEGLALTLDDPARVGRLYVYMTGHLYMMGDQERAFEMGQRAESVARRLDDFSLTVSTNAYLGQIHHARGDYRQAADCFRRNVTALVGDLAHERLGLPQLPSVHSRTCLVWSLAELGDFEEGAERGEEAIRIAEAVNQPFSLTVAYSGLGNLYLRQGNVERALPLLERGLELSRAWSIPLWFPRLASDLGLGWNMAGRPELGQPLLAQAVERAAGMRLVVGHSAFVAAQSEGCLLAGRLGEAANLARHALELARRHAEKGNEARALRLVGETALVLTPVDPDPACDVLRQAVDQAGAVGMRPLVARSRLGLGRGCGIRGDRAEALAHITAAAASFAEMRMELWRAQAEAELAALG